MKAEITIEGGFSVVPFVDKPKTQIATSERISINIRNQDGNSVIEWGGTIEQLNRILQDLAIEQAAEAMSR